MFARRDSPSVKLSVWSEANKVENIELFRQHCVVTSNQQRVQADDVTSRTFVYIQTNMEEKLIVAVCGHRPELTGPQTGLRSAWGTAGTGRHPDGAPGGDSEITPAPCFPPESPQTYHASCSVRSLPLRCGWCVLSPLRVPSSAPAAGNRCESSIARACCLTSSSK